jgi:hypothetical protein
VCVQVSCVYLLSAASTVIRNSNDLHVEGDEDSLKSTVDKEGKLGHMRVNSNGKTPDLQSQSHLLDVQFVLVGGPKTELAILTAVFTSLLADFHAYTHAPTPPPIPVFTYIGFKKYLQYSFFFNLWEKEIPNSCLVFLWKHLK